MLKTLRDAFKVKELRNKIFYTFLMLVVIRIGSLLPIPGVDTTYFNSLFDQSNDAFEVLNAFTGGSFLQMSVFALSITPYITSSIIMQLMTIAIPKLEEMQKEGEDGRKKIAEITRYVTVALALFESVVMAIGFGSSGLIKNYAAMSTGARVWSVIIIICCLTAGSALLMWIGENITEKGVGNGISIVLLFNIVSRIPEDMYTLFANFVFNQEVARGVLAALIIIAVIVVMVVLVCILQDAVRKIPVQYSQKVVGRKSMGGNSSVIPLKVNTAGVIPVIFASSLLSTPIIIAQFLGYTAEWTRYLSSSYWCNPQYPKYTIGLVVYIVLVVFFAYFYTSITFNPLEVANNLKKSGGFIPGIRPGKPTSDKLNELLNYIVFIGAIGLIIVCVIPIVISGVFKASVSFSGTSLIIIVGVVLETLKSIESQMVVRTYKGFLK
ncbi:MAG: preprotein translocase subunit SecY [Lachnospiraceae bacterium]|nr:preprotein translocase subunit SecY [Lachnospiraceae bacterium]